jgi:2-methylaconitate cis-trans-isomerase PrpF
MSFIEEQKRIRTVIMRGGTSRALFVMRNELPADPEVRDRVILRMYGSPDVRQIDGLGGADPLTSKLAIIGPATSPDADVDYTFGQVSITDHLVDYAGNCGNISSAVGPYAIDEGLVEPIEPVTTVRIHQTNTECILVAQVPVRNGKAAVEGDYHIDGVPGTGARIALDFSDTAGAITGKLLPTGNPIDTLDVPGVGPIDVSIVDAGTPCVFVRAQDMGISGTEVPQRIDADRDLNERIERIRGVASAAVGIVDNWQDAARKSPYLPFFAMIAPAADYTDFVTGGTIGAAQVDLVSRLLFMLKMHKAYPVTGTVCTGAAAKIPGTIVYDAARPESYNRAATNIGHPAGIIAIDARVEMEAEGPRLVQAALGRTARRLMEGYAFVPWNILG